MNQLFLAGVFVSLLLSGCAHTFSENDRKLVDNSITFAQLNQTPQTFVGKIIILGGVIAAANNTGEGGLLEVVQFALASDDTPLDKLESGGRFLAYSPEHLDMSTYYKGRLVTIIGEFKGKRSRPLGEIEYSYPLISIREIHAWYNEEQNLPRELERDFDPYYWGYPGDPYFNRPVGPAFKRN